MLLPAVEIGRRIREVREEVGTTQEALADVLGTTTQTVKQIEAGTLQSLPGDYILIIAKALKTDFRYFITREHDDVNEGVRKLFRALSKPKPQDLLALRRFISFATAESELEILLDLKKPPHPPKYPTAETESKFHKIQGKLAARIERRRLGLGKAPIEDIFHLIRAQGIGLTRQRMKDSHLSGVTILHPRAGIFVMVNFQEDLYRQFFSAAHEYCHVLFDREQIRSNGCVVSYDQAHRTESRPGKYSDHELMEMRANSFASEFLVPEESLEQYQPPKSWSEIIQLAGIVGRRHRTNTETVVYALGSAGLIPPAAVDRFKRERPVVIPRTEKKDPEIPSSLNQLQASRRQTVLEYGISGYFLELLRRAFNEHIISKGRFAEMLDMSPQQADDFIKETGLAT